MSLSSKKVDHSSVLSLVKPTLALPLGQHREWWKSGVDHPATPDLDSASQDRGISCIKRSFFLYPKITILPVLNDRWSGKWKGYSKFEDRRTLRIPIHFGGRIIKKEDPQYKQQQEMESYCQNNYNWRIGPTGTAV